MVLLILETFSSANVFKVPEEGF